SLLLSTPLNDEQKDFVKTIQESSDSLLNIVNDILDFSKIEKGRVTCRVAPFSIRSVLEGQVQLLKAQARNKNISMIADVSPDIPNVSHGDPIWLGQILSNLMSNAIKFTQEGSV